MYARLPTEKELDGTGLSVSDYEEEAEVWPENWATFRLFSMMQSQWDAGFNGPVGMKYQVLFEIMDRQGMTGDSWWEVFDDIRDMEAAALNAMRDKK